MIVEAARVATRYGNGKQFSHVIDEQVGREDDRTGDRGNAELTDESIWHRVVEPDRLASIDRNRVKPGVVQHDHGLAIRSRFDRREVPGSDKR